ncbi:hypothetical protein [Maribacter sp. 2307ULW6-5]|uniref:hypothetical protein n=1 Tax=Maribacter sp. 2307ULW6-5 TaxID=3386275 RepID=UPI0039BCFFFC
MMFILMFPLFAIFGLFQQSLPIASERAMATPPVSVMGTVSASEVLGVKEELKVEEDGNTERSLGSYDDEKKAGKELAHHLKTVAGHRTLESHQVGQRFTAHLVNRIFPHWYGTEWTFNGHTAVPKKGSIACGYFVSTTLRDMGLNLNRYHMAQKGPLDEAQMISSGSAITTITAQTAQEAMDALDAYAEEGLYFIGFDKGHVGFLLKEKGQLSLIHSNYLWPVSVVSEPLEKAAILNKFSTYHLVPITHNPGLMQKWLAGTIVR